MARDPIDLWLIEDSTSGIATGLVNKKVAIDSTTDEFKFKTGGVIYTTARKDKVLLLDGTQAMTGTLNLNGNTLKLHSTNTRISGDGSNLTLDVAATTILDLSASSILSSVNFDLNGNTLILDVDGDTSIRSTVDDTLTFKVANADTVFFTSSLIVFNALGTNIDFQVSGDNVANLLYIKASTDRIGIGTDSPDHLLQLETSSAAVMKMVSGGSNDVQIQFWDGAQQRGQVGWDESESVFKITSLAFTRKDFIIDVNGQIGIGITPQFALHIAGSQARCENDGGGSTFLALSYGDASSGTPGFVGFSARGTKASPTIVQNGDTVLTLIGRGWDPTDTEWLPAASIEMEIDGTPGDDDMPGRIIFNTTNDGSSSVSEKMRIDNAGYVRINQRLGVGKTPASLLDVLGIDATVINFIASNDASHTLTANFTAGDGAASAGNIAQININAGAGAGVDSNGGSGVLKITGGDASGNGSGAFGGSASIILIPKTGDDDDQAGSSFLYFGDSATNGSWRIHFDLNISSLLTIERRETGSWVIKTTFIA